MSCNAILAFIVTAEAKPRGLYSLETLDRTTLFVSFVTFGSLTSKLRTSVWEFHPMPNVFMPFSPSRWTAVGTAVLSTDFSSSGFFRKTCDSSFRTISDDDIHSLILQLLFSRTRSSSLVLCTASFVVGQEWIKSCMYLSPLKITAACGLSFSLSLAIFSITKGHSLWGVDGGLLCKLQVSPEAPMDVCVFLQ